MARDSVSRGVVGKLVNAGLFYTVSSFFFAPEMIGFDFRAQGDLWMSKTGRKRMTEGGVFRDKKRVLVDEEYARQFRKDVHIKEFVVEETQTLEK
jgi:hypothetical protein